MKKMITFLTALLMLTALFPFHAPADEPQLPFELNAPANVAVYWLNGDDSPTTMCFSYSVSNQMAQFFQEKAAAGNSDHYEQFMADLGMDDIWVSLQIDWALDDVNDPVSGWHYNEYWDGKANMGFGNDENGNHRYSEWDYVEADTVGEETVKEVWIMRGVPEDERWYGVPDTQTPGVKDQLKEDQYDYHDDNVWIDFGQHTAYFRARFAVTVRTLNDAGARDSFYYSDWSDTVAYGKDAAVYEPLTAADLAAPVISGLRMTDKEFNGNPVAAFTLTVPDELAAKATQVAAMHGSLYVETEARVKGDAEWTVMGNCDNDVKPGELECALLTLVNDTRPTIAKDTEIELRCRYCCSQPELDDIYSDYSEVITFGTEDITAAPDVTAAASEDATQEDVPAPVAKKTLGIGLYIGIGAAVLLLLIVILVIAKKAKKKES